MNLDEILRGFNASLNEEQAWAICHQYAKKLTGNRNPEGCAKATNLQSIVISKEGEISISNETVVNSQRELIESFGRVLFEALEYGTDSNDEKLLSPDIERLIERMTLSYDGIISEEDDEGYEEEHMSLDRGPCTWNIVVKICEEHLGQPVQANAHYLAVCRALITEAVDLKSFLEKVSTAGESLKSLTNINNNNDVLDGSQSEEFPKLNFTEWAHLWIQVVSDLRFGVKLKKVEGYTRNVEYELTPYEILMEDIRQRKYTLKKVSIDGDILHRVKKDAHDIILDFIKSRPTLNPSKNRKLRPPPPRSKSLHERLLEQIQLPPSPLRHVTPPDDSPSSKKLSMVDSEFEHRPISLSKSCDFNRMSENRNHARRVIKAPTLSELETTDISTPSDQETDSEDFSSSFAFDSIATDDVTSSTINDESLTPSPFIRHNVNSNRSSLRSSGTSGVSSGGPEEHECVKPGVFQRNTSTVRRKKILSVELLPSPVLSTVPDSSFDSVAPLESSYTKYSSRNGVRRANSMAGVRSAITQRHNVSDERRINWRERRAMSQKAAKEEFDNLNQMPPPTCTSSPLPKRDRREWRFLQTSQQERNYGIQRTMSDRRFAAPPRQNDRWKYPIECLELTVEELIHIRQVLARAELEKYQGQGELYSNLKKGKVCFHCKIRKFSVFWWACTCQICKQKICSKCMRKVRTPTDEYLHTPVYSLSPPWNPLDPFELAAMGPENMKNPISRLTSGSSGVLRERNGINHHFQVTKSYDVTSWGIPGTKGRKMDVCEECCSLISRIIQTNRIATMHHAPKPTWTTRDSSDLARFVFARPTSVADRLLRRSTSSASFMTSCMPAHAQRHVATSISVQSFHPDAK